MNFVSNISCAAIAISFLATASVALADNDASKEINELLKGELSAVETYNQALGKYSDAQSASLLKTLRTEHEGAVTALNAEVTKHGGMPATGSGAWGVWAKAVTGGAKMVSESAALKALKEGEEHGLKEYQDVLEDKDVPESCKSAVRAQLLPKQKEHIAELDAAIAKAM